MRSDGAKREQIIARKPRCIRITNAAWGLWDRKGMKTSRRGVRETTVTWLLNTDSEAVNQNHKLKTENNYNRVRLSAARRAPGMYLNTLAITAGRLIIDSGPSFLVLKWAKNNLKLLAELNKHFGTIRFKDNHWYILDFWEQINKIIVRLYKCGANAPHQPVWNIDKDKIKGF